MIYDAASLARLVTWFVFVFWDPLFVEKDDSQAFYRKIKRVWWQPPAWLFGVVWGFLQLLLVAAIYLFTEFSTNSADWTFIVVTILFLVQELIRKTWSYVFFRMRQVQWALAIAATLMVLGVLLVVFTGVAEQCELRFVVMAFFIVYTAWLTFAVVLNASFLNITEDEKEETLLPVKKPKSRLN